MSANTRFLICEYCKLSTAEPEMFRMWQELFPSGSRIKDAIIVTCRKPQCEERITSSNRVYESLPWGREGPGKFIKLCGNCQFRSLYSCTVSSLKENGGPGVSILHAGRSKSIPPAITCMGKQIAGEMLTPKSTFQSDPPKSADLPMLPPSTDHSSQKEHRVAHPDKESWPFNWDTHGWD